MTTTSARNGFGPCFLGIDGGGSKTLAVVVDADGQERGRALAGSANYAAVGVEQAMANLHAAAEQAAQAAGCHLPVKAAWLGLAGVDRPADHALLLPHVQPLAETIRLTNDAELLLSALDAAVGVALVAGTGSIALGRDARGFIVRAGGWGHILGDEGSGYDIGRLALQAATRAADGRGEATALLEGIMTEWNLERPDDMIGRVYGDDDKAAIARLSSLVFQATQDGDRVARKIAQHAADELALAALTVCAALDFSDKRVALALGGGLLIHEAALRSQVLRRLRRRLPLGRVAMVEQPALSAALAAITLATSSAWTSAPEDALRNAH
ncbi:MAG TPA: BadF/BadG/BcrA/BcrD ATPase family protein [Ktedonobacterales bacterium]|nr:BadF/BadG/BcrA/BcrD ATPase family protein [Ktedonobacterales bacterium]